MTNTQDVNEHILIPDLLLRLHPTPRESPVFDVPWHGGYSESGIANCLVDKVASSITGGAS